MPSVIQKTPFDHSAIVYKTYKILFPAKVLEKFDRFFA